jgi:hypothetical protein
VTADVWTSGPVIAWWVFLWYAIFVVFAIGSFRKRHILWFVLGFLLPVCWLIGALLPDRRRRRREEE